MAGAGDVNADGFEDIVVGAYQNDAWTLALSDNDWRRLGGSPQQAPSARDAVRGVTDVPRDRMVVFGGYDGQYLQDTWALSLSAPQKWTSLAPAGTPPAPRLLHTAIYDPIRDRVLVFGGESKRAAAIP